MEQRLSIFMRESHELLEKGSHQNEPFEVSEYVARTFRKISDNPDKIYKKIRNESRKGQFVADQVCRRDPNLKFPQSQIHLYDSSFSFSRRPFGLPSFYYHYGKRLIRKSHEKVHEIGLDLKSAGKKHSVEMYTSHASIYERNPDGSNGPEVVRFSNPMYSTPTFSRRKNTRRERVFLSDRELCLKNGEIHDNTSGNAVETTLNGNPLEELRIQRLEFSSSRSRTCDVLVLFDQNFMAGGTARITREHVKIELSEIPGTYGTTDFICDRNFKSMVRTSQLPPSSRGKMTESSLNDDYLKKVTEAVRNGHFEHKKDEFLHELCPNIRLLCLIFGKLDSFDFSPSQQSWDPVQKLAFVSEKVSESTNVSQCKEFDVCIEVDRLCGISEKLMAGEEGDLFEEDKEILDEYKFQVSMALLALASIINEENINHEIKEVILLMTDFRQMYILPVKKIISFLLLLPDKLIPRTMEVLVTRATHRDTSSLLQLYDHNPQLVLKTFEDLPHLLFFSPHPIWPKIGFLNEYFNRLEEVENRPVQRYVPSPEQAQIEPPVSPEEPVNLRKVRGRMPISSDLLDFVFSGQQG